MKKHITIETVYHDAIEQLGDKNRRTFSGQLDIILSDQSSYKEFNEKVMDLLSESRNKIKRNVDK